MNGIKFQTQDELRILSAALCTAQREALDGGSYMANDPATIDGMKRRVDVELQARYRANKPQS